jgi:hypothetical protein
MNYKEFKQTKIYKDWLMQPMVAYMFAPYGEQDPYNEFIVIVKKDDMSFDYPVYDIYRFFPMGEPDNLTVNCDVQDLTAEEVFKAIIENYSEPMKYY